MLLLLFSQQREKQQKTKMIYISTFSTGKDSEAVTIWAKNNLPEFETVFCDTGWESPKSYLHLKQVEEYIGNPIKVLRSSKYNGFIDLCIKKKRVASTKARFCTEELKTKPMIDYILSLNDDITILQGVRNDESESRRNMKEKDEFFKFYFEPYGYIKSGKNKGKPLFHTYRKKEVIAYCNKFSVDVFRPIIKWTAAEVFDYIFSNNRKANPLYYEGFSRVGCFPCISCRHAEIRLIAQKYPERINKIRELEAALGSTFFPSNYIPKQHCDRSTINKKGKKVFFASIDAVVKYVLGNPDQEKIFDMPKGCVSVYNICETN